MSTLLGEAHICRSLYTVPGRGHSSVTSFNKSYALMWHSRNSASLIYSYLKYWKLGFMWLIHRDSKFEQLPKLFTRYLSSSTEKRINIAHAHKLLKDLSCSLLKLLSQPSVGNVHITVHPTREEICISVATEVVATCSGYLLTWLLLFSWRGEVASSGKVLTFLLLSIWSSFLAFLNSTLTSIRRLLIS